MNTDLQRDASTLRALHFVARRPLLIANAWDVPSARVIEAAGAPVIATTSAGVAWALGRADGDVLARNECMAAVRRIIEVVTVPVSVDVEGGYGEDAAGVAETVAAVIGAGAVGINIEDGSRDPGDAAERIAAARRAAVEADVPLFINARTDVYLAGLVAPELQFAETLDRARRYLAAGADGIFVPGVDDLAVIERLVKAIAAPVNVMVGPGAPSVAELARVGVARVSLGSGVAQAAYAVARRAAEELLASGTYGVLGGAVDYAEMNALVSRA